MRIENSTYADKVWLPTNYYGATNVNATSLNDWAIAMQTANYSAQPTPVAKKKPETAVAWLREQVEEVTQLAA